MDHIVIDVEIKKRVMAPPDNFTWDDTDKLGVACAAVYEFTEDRFRLYGDTEEQLHALKQRLWRADRITTYNGWKFDFPVIAGLPGRERVEALRPKSDDLLRRIWQALEYNPDVFNAKTHSGWSLDAVAKGCLGRGKTGNGAGAPELYQAGRWTELLNYCMEDVALTRDLAKFIADFGYVVNNSGQRVTVHEWVPNL